jgi:hypothetical protein
MRHILDVHVAQRDGILGGDDHLLGERAIVEVVRQTSAAFASKSPALQCDIRCECVVAGSHGGVAPDQISGSESGCVGSDRDDAADRTHTRLPGKPSPAVAAVIDALRTR